MGAGQTSEGGLEVHCVVLHRDMASVPQYLAFSLFGLEHVTVKALLARLVTVIG